MIVKSLKFIPIAFALSIAAAAAQASPEPVQVEVVADDGSVYARYDLVGGGADGTLRAYLQAERGRNYGIRVRNHAGERIGLVIAVDGRNIISGEKSYLRPDEPMYVLGAWQQATYEGWRTSDANVQRFYFTSAQDSYAEAWGDGSAMGVIAVAAFREVPRVDLEQRSESLKTTPRSPAPGASRAAESAAAGDAAAGTGFGESHASRSVRVHFEPQQRAFSKQFLKYEWRETLVRLGIIGESPPANRFWPEQIGEAQGFAPYPPGYWSRRR